MMTLSKKLWYWQLLATAVVCGANTFSDERAWSQVIGDNTLGVESSQVTASTPGVVQIDGGATRGTNLFHSFEQFSIPTGGTAYFNNALGIQNIISRVTGSSVSNIDGSIRAIGIANLFLINPSGIIFGPNAKLNIGGSFVASTASSLNFADGTQFSATTPQTTPLLTVSVPLGLQFGETTASILNQSRVTSDQIGLQVQSGKTLALVGGDVLLAGGALRAGDVQMQTPGGRIELGSVADNSMVSLRPTDKGWVLGYEGVQNFKDIQLSQGSTVNASGEGGGDIQVQGRRVTLTERSSIVSLTRGGKEGGTLTLNASESLELIGIGTDEPVEKFIVDSVEDPSSSLFDGIFSVSMGSGAAGDVVITTPKFIARAGAFVVTSTFSKGPAGNLTVNSAESVELSESVLTTASYPQAVGAAGDLEINTGQLIAEEYGFVTASSLGEGAAGKLTVRASQSVQLTGKEPSVFALLPNQSPEITLNTGLFNGSQSAEASRDIYVETRQLMLREAAFISASTDGKAVGGNVIVNASESVELSGSVPRSSSSNIPESQYSSRLSATASSGSSGQGGKVTITTGKLTVRDGGRVNVFSDGTGDAGELKITAGSIFLEEQGLLDATTSASGNGGNITLEVQDLLLLRNKSTISTAAAGNNQNNGNGGNITLDAPLIVAVPAEDSDISANAFTGNGGRVEITAQGIFGLQFREQSSPASDITANSDFGLDGVVEINTPDVDPSRGLVALPAELVDASGLIAQGCGASETLRQSEFIITGRGGLPPNPSDTLKSDAVWIDLGMPIPGQDNRPIAAPATNSTRVNAPTQIVEATGWVFNDKGEVVLTASVSTATPYSLGPTTAQCYVP